MQIINIRLHLSSAPTSDICKIVMLFSKKLVGARASTGLCVDVSSGVPPGNDINESRPN